jgi:Endonuclease/Exonuclease/phosphatase family
MSRKSLLVAVVSCALILSLGTSVRVAYGQLRIVDYNTANGTFPSGNNYLPRTGMDNVLQAIANEVTNGIAKPIDVLIFQEHDEPYTTTAAFVNLLNGIYGAGTYARSTVITLPTYTNNIRQTLIYNTNTLTLIDEKAFGSTGGSAAARQSARFQLRPVGYDSSADFYIYNDHYLSGTTCCGPTSDQGRRDFEAQTVRIDADALGQGAHVIYAGDYNIHSSSEAMYQTLLDVGNGQAFDPINSPGNWNNSSSFASIHTQSPHDGTDGLVTGGMDDRFDFQLVTGELLDDEGMSYIPGSYHAFGNNGTTYNQAVNAASNTYPLPSSTLDDLAHVSDHLPVVADYQLPAKMLATLGTVPTNVAKDSMVSIDVFVENVANVVAAIGADELDYSISVSGALSGTPSGTAFALAGSQSKQVLLDTSTLGPQSGMVTVSTSSQGAANAMYSFPVNFTVDPGGGPVFGVIARDDFDSPLNLNSFSQNPAPGAFSNAGDGFEKYQEGVSSTIPFYVADDSVYNYPGDTIGIIDRATKLDAWFGVTDLLNDDNPSGMGTATWEFNIAGATNLEVSIDMGAMGDFEAGADTFDWTYSIDGGPALPLFTSSVDEATDATYTLAIGSMFTLDDPLSMTNTSSETTELSNILQTITSQLTGTGSTLTIQLVAANDAESQEGYAFDNIIVSGLTGGDFLEADFNEDTFVDALDLAQWEEDYGVNGNADADGDGDSDGDDFLVWQQQIGQSSSLLATSQTVPEPATAWFVLLGLPLLCRVRRRLL